MTFKFISIGDLPVSLYPMVFISVFMTEKYFILWYTLPKLCLTHFIRSFQENKKFFKECVIYWKNLYKLLYYGYEETK